MAEDHIIEASALMTYSLMISKDTVRIAFKVAALNNLEVLILDISSAYLMHIVMKKCIQMQDQHLGLMQVLTF